MLHHCNIDRIYALYQDYWNQDLIDKDDLTDNEYTSGRNYGRDDPLPFLAAGNYPSFFWTPTSNRPPTPRELHHSYGDLVRVTYANDHLGLVLSNMQNSAYSTSNNQSWVQISNGEVPVISCSWRLYGEGSNKERAI